VHAVASHGQTIRHLPGSVRVGRYRVNGTLQLGSLDHIAAATGLTTVGNFRQADVAVGGEGAPITIGAMARLFGDRTRSRLIVNIGGMSNYFYIPAGAQIVSGRDCGPGNVLCDLLMRHLFDKPWDRNGRVASRGRVSQRLLSLLLAHPFFNGRTASTGREAFGTAMVREIISFGRRFDVPDEDLLATAAELTTMTIATSVFPLVERNAKLADLYLMGGGRRNRHFCNRLAHHLPDLDIKPVEELGVDGDYIEAAAFAVMGAACLRSETLPGTATAAKRKTREPISGHIVQPPKGIGK